MRISIFLFYLAIVSFSQINAQESDVPINYEGKDFTSLKHAWTAQWITHPTASTLDYNVFLYRNNFELNQVPSTYTVHVSADNQYRLYVNGQKVSSGPSRGDINHWRYETVDITPFLEKGKNVIAAEVVNFGEFRHAAQQTFQTAFILQSPHGVEPNLNTNPQSNWKISHNTAHNYTPFVSDSVGGYYAAGPGDIIDGNLYPWGWKTVDFDDSHWLATRPGTVEFAVGRGFLFGSTWYLVPRTIPQMKEEVTRFDSVITSHSTIKAGDLLSQKKTLFIPPHQKVKILLDHKTHTIGYPELRVSKGKNATIKATYAEALFYAASSDRTAHKGWKKGHREEWEGKEIRGIYDVFIADGGANRLFKPMAMRTFRFVELEITTEDEGLVIDDYYNVFTAYPFEEKASFTSNDKNLDEIWDTSWRTLQNSSTDLFIDPYYEQLQYVGDARIESLVSIYVSGDDRLMRKAIQSFDASRLSDGLTQSRFPSYVVQIIPTYSLLWVGMAHDYYMYQDDLAFLKQFKPGMESVLGWFERKVDHTGMLGNLNWWNFTDWTKGFQNGIPPGADDGHSANVSMQFVYALRQAAELFHAFGDTEQATHYYVLAQEIEEAVFKHCYVKERGLLAERPEKDVFSQHTNVFAVLADAYAEEEQANVMKTLLEDEDLIQSSIYFRFYVTRALQKVGMGDLYTQRLQPWNNMLDNGMTTFGETDQAPRSDCHAWSASPCFDFLHTIAGIHPSSPLFKTVAIEPNFGHLTMIKANFPHPNGIISMEISKVEENITGKVVLPANLTGAFSFKGESVELHSGENSIQL